MRDIYDIIHKTEYATCRLNDDPEWPRADGSEAPLLRARIECQDRNGNVFRTFEVGGLEICPTGRDEAEIWINARRGRATTREHLGRVDDGRRSSFEEQVAVLALGRMAGFAPSSEAYGELSSLDLLRGLANNLSKLALTPEVRMARETILWDDAWYGDPEAFALDFEELGGDATDEQALAAFVDQRLSEDFTSFLEAAEQVLGTSDAGRALIALETDVAHGRCGVVPEPPSEGFATALVSGTVGRALSQADGVRIVDRARELVIEAGSSSFVLRRVSEEKAQTMRRVLAGLDRTSSLARVWDSAGPLWMGDRIAALEADRSVTLERDAESRCGNEPLSAQASSLVAGTAPEPDGHGARAGEAR